MYDIFRKCAEKNWILRKVFLYVDFFLPLEKYVKDKYIDVLKTYEEAEAILKHDLERYDTKIKIVLHDSVVKQNKNNRSILEVTVHKRKPAM